MAIHAHSTTAPARPLLPLAALPPRDACGRFVKLAPEVPPGPLLSADALHNGSGLLRFEDTPEAIRADLDALLADHARTLHLRRELHQALDHGFALLDALDLGPAALDEIDHAIRVLDALDAPDEDMEPYLTGSPSPFGLDLEDDTELDEGTALESFGRGFVRAGEDDTEDDDPAEDSDPPERDDHHGTEDDAFPWRREPSLVAFAVSVAHV